MNHIEQDAHPSLADRLVGGPQGLRQRLQQLGPIFIKIGQFLALRPDILPQEYCDELMYLLDRVPPFPWQEARAILTEELGREATDIFAYVNPKPIGAGSLAQTHVARLHDGTEVAIKIQRPNIRRLVLRDLRRSRRLARLLELSGVALIVSPREVVDEVTEWMLQEINFTRELENMSRLYRLTERSPYERIPRPYPHLSTARVLTAEYLRGISVAEVLHALRSDCPEEHERITKLGINRDQLAENIYTACLTQMFRYQFFHADLHPGNLLAMPGDVVGFIDFGLCDQLDEIVRERQLRYLSAAYSGRAEPMFKALMEILIPGERTDIEAFRRGFFAATSTWQRRNRADAEAVTSGGRSPAGQWMIDVMRLARQHGFQIPSSILSMYRTLLTAEAVANQLRVRLSLRAVGEQFFRRLQIDEVLRLPELNEFQSAVLSLLGLLRNAPSQLQQMLADLAEGRFSINMTVTESQKVVRAQNRRARLLVTSILSVGIAVLLTRPALPEVFGVTLAWPLGIVLMLLYIGIFIQWRRL
jgi:ubiquinone biosynthesis protein